MFKSALSAVAIAASFTWAIPSWAALPVGSLQFSQPSGMVGALDVVDVWMTFTLNADSSALQLSPGVVSGFVAGDLPLEGSYYNQNANQTESRPFASFTEVFLNTYFGCSDSFTNNCNGPQPRAYSYSFFTSSEPGKPSINFLQSFDLLPGQSTQYVFAQFTPEPGGAPAGDYVFFDTGLTLNFVGLDADGNKLTFEHLLGASCASQETACEFSRSVTAVPEPENWAMLLGGLAAMAALSLRRRQIT